MLHKCANPACRNTFRKLNQGKLFLVEANALDVARPEPLRGRSSRRIEHYWLCDQCAPVLTLSYERGRGIVAVPIAQSVRKIRVPSLQVGEVPTHDGDRTEQSLQEGA